jgi:CBS domain-containing protein
MSDTILTLTALNNTLSIILFHGLFVVLGALGVVATVGGTGRWVALDLIMTSLGSIALGVVLGFLFSVLFAKVRLSEFLLFFFAVLIGLGSGADFLAQRLHLSFNFLLTCLFLGATFANITVNTGPLAENLKMMATPIMACFFVVAGFELHLDELTHLGWLGFAYVALRTLGKYAGVRLGARWAGATFELRSYLGLGLLCQAGVAIGLADFLAASWVDAAGGMHPLAGHFKTIVLGSVVLFELIGPVALKQVVKSSGEVKAITLLRRPRPAGGSGDSATKSSWRALTRVFRTSKSTGPTDVAELTVGHIMRSNVKFLPASANLDEVLHYVEGSRYNHFPVVDEAGDSVGMIHFADLRDMIYDPQMRNLVTAVDLAAPQDYVPADMPLSELLETFRRRDVGSLVVVQSRENRRVLGLVEQRDLLRTLGGEST